MLVSRRIAIDNRDGWILDVRRVASESRFDESRPPIVFVPGYGMNTHILSFHPRGRSMVDYLCEGGYEVWLANLRGQGQSTRRKPGRSAIGLADLAHVDLPVVLDRVLEETRSRAGRLHLVGCSLGAALGYAYLAHAGPAHPLASLVSLAGPFRWERAHPVVRWMAGRARLVSRIPMVGTRRAILAAMPLLQRFPVLLAPYMNARGIDLSRIADIVQTVDDPPPQITRELGEWIVRRTLEVGGIDVEGALAGLRLPILCVVASGDGIVPPETVTAVRSVMAGPVDVVEVGDRHRRFAHADLFVNDEAEAFVFAPMRSWLDDVVIAASAA